MKERIIDPIIGDRCLGHRLAQKVFFSAYFLLKTPIFFPLFWANIYSSGNHGWVENAYSSTKPKNFNYF